MASSNRRLRESSPDTIHGKFLVAYHGWYTCPGDGQPLYPDHNGWHKWFERPIPDRGHPRFDLYPDVESYSPQELYEVPGLTLPDGQPAKLFSSRHPTTVNRHFHLMAEHAIDGVFLMRLAKECEVEGQPWSPLANLMRVSDEVLDRVRAAAEAEGRVWAIMYDLAGIDPGKLSQILRVDWGHLVLDRRILHSPNYLCEGGKPVIGIKGIGMKESYQDPGMVLEIINQLRAFTPGGAYILAGVSPSWRTPGEGDHDGNPGFHAVYEEVDALSPWAVGRVSDIDSVDWYAAEVKEDIKTVRNWNQESIGRKRVDYIPVAFPGLSRSNLTNGAPYNEIPRRGGTLLWRQIYHYQREGAHTIIGASFDDFGSSTALMPAVTLSRLLPNEVRFLALDADGETNLPSDWYLRISGMAGEALRGEKRIATDLMPKKELDDYWAMRPKYEEEDSGTGGGGGGSGSGSNAFYSEAGPAPVNGGQGSSAPPSAAGAGSASVSGPRMESGAVDFDNLQPPPPAYSLMDDETAPSAPAPAPAPAPANVAVSVVGPSPQATMAPSAPTVPSSRPPVGRADTTELAYAVVGSGPGYAGGMLPAQSPPPNVNNRPDRQTTGASPLLPAMENLSLQSSHPTVLGGNRQSRTPSPRQNALPPGPLAQGASVYPQPWSPPQQSNYPSVQPGEIFPSGGPAPSLRPTPGSPYPPYSVSTAPQTTTMFPAGPGQPGSSQPHSASSRDSSPYRPPGSPARTEPGFNFPIQAQDRPASPPLGGFASPELMRQQSSRISLGAIPHPPVHPQRLGTQGNTPLPPSHPSAPMASISCSGSVPPGAYPSGGPNVPSSYPGGPFGGPSGGYSTYPGSGQLIPNQYPGSGQPPPGQYPGLNANSPYPQLPSGPQEANVAYYSGYNPSMQAPMGVPHPGMSPSLGTSTYPGRPPIGASPPGPMSSSYPGQVRPASSPLHQGSLYGSAPYPQGYPQPGGLPPRQNSNASTNSTTFPTASTGGGSSNRPSFGGFQMPTALPAPARQALDKYTSEETRKKLEHGLDSASKWLNNLRK